MRRRGGGIGDVSLAACSSDSQQLQRKADDVWNRPVLSGQLGSAKRVLAGDILQPTVGRSAAGYHLVLQATWGLLDATGDRAVLQYLQSELRFIEDDEVRLVLLQVIRRADEDAGSL